MSASPAWVATLLTELGEHVEARLTIKEFLSLMSLIDATVRHEASIASNELENAKRRIEELETELCEARIRCNDAGLEP